MPATQNGHSWTNEHGALLKRNLRKRGLWATSVCYISGSPRMPRTYETSNGHKALSPTVGTPLWPYCLGKQRRIMSQDNGRLTLWIYSAQQKSCNPSRVIVSIQRTLENIKISRHFPPNLLHKQEAAAVHIHCKGVGHKTVSHRRREFHLRLSNSPRLRHTFLEMWHTFLSLIRYMKI